MSYSMTDSARASGHSSNETGGRVVSVFWWGGGDKEFRKKLDNIETPGGKTYAEGVAHKSVDDRIGRAVRHGDPVEREIGEHVSMQFGLGTELSRGRPQGSDHVHQMQWRPTNNKRDHNVGEDFKHFFLLLLQLRSCAIVEITLKDDGGHRGVDKDQDRHRYQEGDGEHKDDIIAQRFW